MSYRRSTMDYGIKVKELDFAIKDFLEGKISKKEFDRKRRLLERDMRRIRLLEK